MALIPLAGDELAAVVTSLEMTARPPLRPSPASPTGLRLIRWTTPRPETYRALFARVGAPWLWFSRLAMADDALAAVLAATETFAVVDRRGIEVGLLELDRRRPPDCEIAFFGLVPELTGRGEGRWLMAEALRLAWTRETRRVWLHTCTLDHPSALGFYRAQGFRTFARAVETFTDPRTLGILPADAAPRVPLVDARHG